MLGEQDEAVAETLLPRFSHIKTRSFRLEPTSDPGFNSRVPARNWIRFHLCASHTRPCAQQLLPPVAPCSIYTRVVSGTIYYRERQHTVGTFGWFYYTRNAPAVFLGFQVSRQLTVNVTLSSTFHRRVHGGTLRQATFPPIHPLTFATCTSL